MLGPTETRTRIARFRVWSANHYTMGPDLWGKWFFQFIIFSNVHLHKIAKLKSKTKLLQTVATIKTIILNLKAVKWTESEPLIVIGRENLQSYYFSPKNAICINQGNLLKGIVIWTDGWKRTLKELLLMFALYFL